MTPYQQHKRKILCEYLDKYPEAPTRMLARMAHKDYPEFFKDIEDARGLLRTYRGMHGVMLRRDTKFNKYFRHEL